MNTKIRRKFISLILSLQVLLLAGCTKNVNCDIKDKHIHVYTNEYGIDRYVSGEREYVGGVVSDRYYRTDEYLLLNEENEKLYKYLSDQNLVSIIENIDVLNSISSNLHDYMEYQYKYNRTYTTTDGKGHTTVHTTPAYSWTTDPNHSRLTGKERVMTHVFYGYNVVKNSNGKYELQKSGPVQDISLLLDMGYGYISNSIFSDICLIDYYKELGIPYSSYDSSLYYEIYNGDKVELILK